MINSETQKIIDELEAQLEICPRCKTKQKLGRVLIRKKAWGGKVTSENQAQLCLPCDEDWRRFAEKKELRCSSSDEDFQKHWKAFLKTEVGSESTLPQALEILRELAGLRIQIAIETQRYAGRFRSRSRRLDDLYPLSGSRFSESGFDSWLDFLMGQVADVTNLKRSLEKEIADQVKFFPIWNMYLKYIPGCGPWLAGFFIASIRDPRRFPGTSNLWGNAGTRVNGDGTAEFPSRGKKLNYDPLLKIAVVQLLPQAMRYQKSRHRNSPYSQLFGYIKLKEEKKAEEAKPEICRIKGCEETDIVNLGYKKNEDGGQVFLGFCCKKTLDGGKPHRFLTPCHRERRVLREIGKKFLADFYHTWLYFLGENPDISRNPRIMWVFEQATKDKKKS